MGLIRRLWARWQHDNRMRELIKSCTPNTIITAMRGISLPACRSMRSISASLNPTRG